MMDKRRGIYCKRLTESKEKTFCLYSVPVYSHETPSWVPHGQCILALAQVQRGSSKPPYFVMNLCSAKMAVLGTMTVHMQTDSLPPLDSADLQTKCSRD